MSNVNDKLYSLLELERGKVYEFHGQRYKIMDNKLICFCDESFDVVETVFGPNDKFFKEVKQKKKITLYRQTLKTPSNKYFQSDWESKVSNYDRKYIIVKTETKYIEVDDE